MARVLVIDDEPDVRDLIAGMLESAGHAVLAIAATADLAAGIEGFCCDLVLTDLNMPGLSGWEVLDCMHRCRPGLPVVAMSGSATEDEPASLSRFTAHIAKPFRRAALVGLVERVLGG